MNKLENFKLKWVFEGSRSNNNGKIWILWRFNLDVQVLVDYEQMLVVKISHPSLKSQICVFVVYAKCTKEERRDLWYQMIEVSNDMEGMPHIVIGDFNVVTTQDEKVRGNDVDYNAVGDFNQAIEGSGLRELGFQGTRFTWCNNRVEEDLIMARLVRCLFNHQWELD